MRTFLQLAFIFLCAVSCSCQTITGGTFQVTGGGGITFSGNGGPICGPPGYLCARTDTIVCQQNNPAPVVGTGLLGAGTIINSDTCFPNRKILRITDSQTDPSRPGHNYMGDTGGSAEVLISNKDDTCFYTGESGGPTIPWTLNKTIMAASRLYASSFPATGGLLLATGATYPYGRGANFSRLPGECKLIAISDSTFHLDSLDLSQVSPPSPVMIADLTTAGCLGGGPAYTLLQFGGISADNNRYLAYGGSSANSHGTQDNYDRMIVYDKALGGCWGVNMVTGTAFGDWGSTGAVTVAGGTDRFGYHNVRIEHGGDYMQVTSGTCLPTCTAVNASYIMAVGSTTITPITNATAASGHKCQGFTHMFDGTTIGGGFYQYQSVLLSNPNAAPVNINTPLGTFPDQHCSTNEMTSGETQPIFDSSESSVAFGLPVALAWDGEVRAAKNDGSGLVLRFAHTYTDSRQAVNFGAQFGIGSVFQGGEFYLLASYWAGTLGNTSGASNVCTYGVAGNCRSDAFLIDLRD